MSKEFWKDWKRKTKLEEAGIKSLKWAKKIILDNIPKSKIIAIYVGGSFVRREMTKKSDVDTWTIITDNKLLKKFDELAEKYRYSCKPPISLSALSLWELEKDKRYLRPTKPRASPSRFIKKIHNYKLIYGKPLKPKKYPIRTDVEDLKDLIGAFHKTFLPLYEQRKFGFAQLLNQVFWLADLEQRVKGKTPPHSWKELAKSIKDKRHIIHEALRFRVKGIKDKKKRARFIILLKKYLNKLEKELK